MERLKKIGKIQPKHAQNIVKSRLGIGFEKLDRDAFDPEKAYDRVAELGVKWVRIQSGWAKTEKEKGVYDFAWIDSIVDNLLLRGLIPWICLCYGNGLYDAKANEIFGAVGIPPINNAEDRRGWENYVKALVSHLQGRVTYFEIWNEPDCWYSWDYQYKPAEYGRFAIETAKYIRTANPEAKVIGGAWPGSDIHFVDEALATGMGESMDIISFHGYSTSAAEDSLKVHYMKALAEKYNPQIQMIQGEAGFQSRSDGNGGLAGGAWTPLKQAKQLSRSMLLDLSTEVLFTSYFSCMDMIEGLHGKVDDKASYLDFGYFGVLGADFDEDGKAIGTYTTKPAYYALQTLASLFSGECIPAHLPIVRNVLESKRVFGHDCDEPTLIMRGFAKPNGSYALAYWNNTDRITTTYESTISFSTAAMPGEVRIVNMLNGDVFALPDDMLEDKGSNRFLLKNIPITDYPLLLTFGNFEE